MSKGMKDFVWMNGERGQRTWELPLSQFRVALRESSFEDDKERFGLEKIRVSMRV